MGVTLRGVITTRPVNAKSVGEKFSFDFAATEVEELLNDPQINTVFVITRHDSHAKFVLEFLKRKKNVFVEKPLAITPEQAEELLPLWNLTKTLIESDTSAQVEVDAVMDSILDAMTDEQMAYIEELQFGPEQFRQIMEDYDIGFGFRGGEGDTGNIPSGGFPPGGFGGVPGQGPEGGQGRGQGFGGFQDLSPEQQATAQAMREERGGGGRGFFGNQALVEALIDLLEGKIE